MNKYDTTPGFTGSEIERAAMSSGIFPMESKVERLVKQRLAKGLTRLANYLDPYNIERFDEGKANNSYC